MNFAKFWFALFISLFVALGITAEPAEDRSLPSLIDSGVKDPGGPIEPPAEPLTSFTNVTDLVGLTGVVGFRLSVADVNNDGYPDIFLHLPQDETTGDVLNKQFLYLNVPGPDPNDPFSRMFIDYTPLSGIRANRQGNNDGRHSDAAIFSDVDNDGDLDCFTSVYVHSSYNLDVGRNDLLLNDGHGHFTLAANSPFHTDPIWNTAGATWLDYDNDSAVDLFVGNWYRPYPVLTADQLYQGHGDGSFTNRTAAAGIDTVPTCIYGVAASDWNNDGWMDLYAPPYSHTVSGSTPVHWRNNGDGTFTPVQQSTNYDDYRGSGSGKASFGSMPRDYDNDGDFDFLEILTHGTGDGSTGVHSTTVTNVNGVFSWDFFRVDGRRNDDPNINHHGDHYGSFFDITNDGLADFALTECSYSNNRIYLFEQASNHTFYLATAGSGLEAINAANLPPHNVIPMDYDLDGDEDVLVGFASSTEGIQLWRNDVGLQNNWLTVTLEGAGYPGRANKSAIGAKVVVTAGGQTYTREVTAGNGHQGPQVPLAMTFGLGPANIVDSLVVHWPNAEQTTTTLTQVAVNQFLTIREVPEPVTCDIDLVRNTHTCGAIPAISFRLLPRGGKTVIQINLDPRGSGYTKAIFDVDYNTVPSGWTVNIGDSVTNNGAGGDGATQSNDAELHILDTTLDIYGRDGSPVLPLARMFNFVTRPSTVRFEVNNRRLTWNNFSGTSGVLPSRWLYALNGQPDREGPVNDDIFAAFNRVIGSSSRTGTGVSHVRIQLVSQPAGCEIDLQANTHTCGELEAVSFVQSPDGGETVFKVNLEPEDSGYTQAFFDVRYGQPPTGWTVNIGDSATNNGGGGDRATQSNDAELNIYGTAMEIYGKDGTPQYPLLDLPGFATGRSLVTLEVSNEKLVWDNHAGEASHLESPYLFALNGQPDSEGPVNYDIFAAFNRVIRSTSRRGTGVGKVILKLIPGSVPDDRLPDLPVDDKSEKDLPMEEGF